MRQVRGGGFDISTESMEIYHMNEDSFPSGPWTGFYSSARDGDRHRMDLTMEFGDGMITGEGSDDIGPFIVRGLYDANNRECCWTKTYVAKHDVFYEGFREEKGIWGTWEVDGATGGFKIWPLASGVNDDSSGLEEKAEPVDAVGELVGAVKS